MRLATICIWDKLFRFPDFCTMELLCVLLAMESFGLSIDVVAYIGFWVFSLTHNATDVFVRKNKQPFF